MLGKLNSLRWHRTWISFYMYIWKKRKTYEKELQLLATATADGCDFVNLNELHCTGT